MKTVTNSIITVNVQSTVAATLKLLNEAGASIGKTSLADLLAGRKENACGFVVVEAAPAEKATKAELAQSIFDANFGEIAPKAVKQLMMEQAGLTANGANTYYYNMKKKAGL